MTSLASRLRKQHGFTLIEMAIVLVIIGLIIAAVTVGKDTMRTAENNKIYAKFISPWNQAAYDYFQKTGTVPTCTSATACKAAILTIGVTLPTTYSLTNSEGQLANVAVASIADDRSSTTGGGMIVTYNGPQSIAFTVDAIMDANVADADGTSGTGPTHGIVRWSVNTDGDSVLDFTVRLRDITGTGSGA